jgi:hypothetical protein
LSWTKYFEYQKVRAKFEHVCWKITYIPRWKSLALHLLSQYSQWFPEASKNCKRDMINYLGLLYSKHHGHSEADLR